MRHSRTRLAAILAAMTALVPATCALAEEAPASTAAAPPAAMLAAGTTQAGITPTCFAGQCEYRLTGPQLLALAERLISDKKYEEARPLVAALRAAPDMGVPYNFLEGMIAIETGDPKTAEAHFRTILHDDPKQTRVRLELARALMAQGDRIGAEYHLRLAQDADDLPPDIARAITQARRVLRSKRDLQFGFDFGLAPDTNINSATNAETVDVNFGPVTLPLTLDEQARARSGTGVTANLFGSLRLPSSERMSFVIDLDAAMINYKGKDADDYSVQLAAGPELRIGQLTTLTLQGVGLYRWYAGKVAARQAGGKATLQHDLSRSQRMGLQFDTRYSSSDFGDAYNGWQVGLVGTYDHVIDKSFIASASVFARREFMKVKSNANSTVGVNLGIGGELPLGINAGVSGGVSYSRYDEPLYFFSSERREDWRWQARAYVGMRKIRVLGFSPSAEYRYASVDTNYLLYRNERHRVNFKLARYF